MTLNERRQRRERLECLHRRRNGSALQMVQTLEMCSPKLTRDGDASSTLRLKKPSLAPLRSTDQSPSCFFILPEGITSNGDVEKGKHCNDRDTLVSVSSGDTAVSTLGADASTVGDEPFEEHGTATAPVAKSTTFTTRRQRRASDTSSCNYSDFCDNDLSRQIEAMVLRVETEYANRRVKKTKQNTATHSVSKRMISKEAAQEVCADTSTKIEDGLVKVPSMHVVHDKESDDVRRNPTNNLLKLINLAQGNTSKSISRKLFNAANANPHQLLRHTLKSMKASDDVPAMKPCDSMASFSSDYSFASMSRSSSHFLNFARSKKSNGAMPGSNAEWAIIE
mmetsp:Transcript_816/g.1443  ORF Transcript_816/g.1443 Transcript_816/m.1443 type:complete len:337 (+) Transcript_816:129-1139(+)